MVDGDISMGPGVVLRSLPRLLDHLGIPGLELDGLKSWCGVLSVPCVEIAGTDFVNIYQLQVAMACATRMGAEDFSLDAGTEPTPVDRDGIVTVVYQLMQWRKTSMKDTHENLVQGARGVAERLEAAGIGEMLKQTQGRWDEEGLRLLRAHRKDIERIEKEIATT